MRGGFGPSDHSSFYAKNVPVFFFFTGDHPDYHRPSDTSDKINIAGMNRVAALVEELGNNLATVAERPQYVKVAGGGGAAGGPSGPRIGFRPSYGDEKEGVLIDGVTPGGPAAKAGLQEGDRIIEVAGKPVKDIQTYMVMMARQKKGEPLELGYPAQRQEAHPEGYAGIVRGPRSVAGNRDFPATDHFRFLSPLPTPCYRVVSYFGVRRFSRRFFSPRKSGEKVPHSKKTAN